jgi:hypothetical protein
MKNKYPIKTLHIFLTGGIGTKKTFTLMCIIQNMLQYCIRETIDGNLLKLKIMKWTYTWKITFNINSSTIQFAFAIPFNKKMTKWWKMW